MITQEQLAQWRALAEYVRDNTNDRPDRGAALRELALLAEVERLRAILAYIDAHAPLADATCAEPGITLSEAARRALTELEAIHDHV